MSSSETPEEDKISFSWIRVILMVMVILLLPFALLFGTQGMAFWSLVFVWLLIS